MAGCLFCQIAKGDIPAKTVGEGEHVIAFRDVNPQAPTHILLIPRAHVADSAAQVTAEHGDLLAELFAMAAQIARDEGLAGGWRLVTNVGEDGGQTIPHLHVHLLGGRAMQWPPG